MQKKKKIIKKIKSFRPENQINSSRTKIKKNRFQIPGQKFLTCFHQSIGEQRSALPYVNLKLFTYYKNLFPLRALERVRVFRAGVRNVATTKSRAHAIGSRQLEPSGPDSRLLRHGYVCTRVPGPLCPRGLHAGGTINGRFTRPTEINGEHHCSSNSILFFPPPNLWHFALVLRPNSRENSSGSRDKETFLHLRRQRIIRESRVRANGERKWRRRNRGGRGEECVSIGGSMTDDRLIVERCSWRGRSSREDIFFFFFFFGFNERCKEFEEERIM